MISVDKAKSVIAREAKKHKGRGIRIELADALRYKLAEDIYAKIPSPPFNQAAMDGYAVLSSDVLQGKLIRLAGEQAAGSPKCPALKSGQAIRIFTGAELPEGSDLVVPQEFVAVEASGILRFDYEQFARGDNVRPKGSQFKKGDRLLGKNVYILAAELATIAAAGYSRVRVYKKPVVHLVVTGNELIPPGKRPVAGKVFETNSIMLRGAMHCAGFTNVVVHFCQDNPLEIKRTFRYLCRSADVILFSGGISVGRHDHVRAVLDQCKARTLFYRIRQKPGKPLYFGRFSQKLIFGLPGNPAASLTCYYEYVLPLLRLLSGFDAQVCCQEARLTNSYKKKPGLTHFLKASYKNGEVTLLPDQESFKIVSFSAANCLAVVPEETEELAAGTRVMCHMLPQYD